MLATMRKPREIQIRFTANDKQIEEKQRYYYICASIEAELKKK